MKSRNLVLVFCLLILVPFNVLADDDEPDVRDLPTRERIIVGGNLGLQIGNISTVVIISPSIAYRVTNRLTSGLGLTYQYYRNRGWGSMSGFTSVTHLYGGSLFSRYSITRQIFAHAEFESLSLDSQMGWRTAPEEGGRFWEQNYFLGGGYRAPIGPRAALNIMLLYNFNSNSVVYFQNPIFRFGVDINL
jgi:hypothetical protein